MNPIASSRTALAALLLVALCLSTAAAAPTPTGATATIRDGTSWKTVPFGIGNCDALLRWHPVPPYTFAARKAHESGSGRFKLNFGPDGKVKKIDVLQSTGGSNLDHSCLWAFGAWRARHPGELQTIVQPIDFMVGQ